MNIKKILPVIGIVILIYIIISLDLYQIYVIFSTINPIYVVLSFLLILPVVLLTNIQWQILLKKQKIYVSFLYSLKNIFIGYFYGFITPGGLGGYTRSLYLSDESKAPLLKCVSNIIIFNTIDYISLLVLGVIGGVLLSSRYPNLLLSIIVMLFFVLILFLFFLKKEKSKIVFTRLIKLRIFENVKEKLEEPIDSFYENLPGFRDVLLPFSISIIGWIIRFTEFFIISKIFDIEVPYLYFILIIAVANVVASIPISIFGLGVREGSLIALFSMFDIASEKILILSLFWFTVIWFTPSVIGAIIAFFESRKRGAFLLNDRTTERFSRYMRKYKDLYKELAIVVRKSIQKSVSKPIIVDLGSGSGLLSIELYKQISNASIIGIDPSEKMLRIANKNVEKHDYESILGKSESMPIKRHSADVVVSRFSLPYWDQPKHSFSEIRDVLKPGGRVVLEALNRDFPRWKLFLIKLHMFINFAGTDVIRYHSDAYKTAYTIEQVERFLTEAQFNIIKRIVNRKDWKFIIIAEKKK